VQIGSGGAWARTEDKAITIIKLYGNWNVQKNDQYVKGFNTLREAKLFVTEIEGAN
jgi:hypothetical protein